MTKEKSEKIPKIILTKKEPEKNLKMKSAYK